MSNSGIIANCSNISKTFGEDANVNNVIKNINLEIKENEFLVVFGPGQCGKTTLLNLIAGLEQVSSGEILVKGKKITGPSPERGMVFQTTALFSWMTVMGNVEFGLKMAGIKKTERRKRAQYFIDLVGLTGFENSFPSKLSGGMCQRVGIARAYCTEPLLILMDEPFGHLDAQTRYLMEEEIEKIYSKEKRTIVFVTNNVEEAIYLADRIIMLTSCPATIKHEYRVDFPRPRKYVDPEFLALREKITAEMDITEQGEQDV